MPVFEWPLKLCGKSCILTDEEINTLDSNMAALLLSGLGIYVPETMTQYAINKVIEKAVAEQLACLWASPDIVYGTNLALTTVFIGTGYGFHATRNALYQLIGRAGRTGRSNKAQILFEDEHTMKRALVSRTDDDNYEAKVMDWHLNSAIEQQANKIAIQTKLNEKLAQEIIDRENENEKQAHAQAQVRAQVRAERKIEATKEAQVERKI